MTPLAPKHKPGDRMDDLTIVEHVGYGTLQKRKTHIYKVVCTCGTVTHRSQFQLYQNSRPPNTNHCGCKSKGPKDYTFVLTTGVVHEEKNIEKKTLVVGKPYNSAVLLKHIRLPNGTHTQPGYLFRCECGSEFTRTVANARSNLNMGKKLACKECQLEARRKVTTEKAEEAPLIREDWAEARKKLKALQDWGYAPR